MCIQTKYLWFCGFEYVKHVSYVKNIPINYLPCNSQGFSYPLDYSQISQRKKKIVFKFQKLSLSINITSTNYNLFETYMLKSFSMKIDICKPTVTKTLRFMFQSAISDTVHVCIRSNFFMFHVNSIYS